MKRVLVGCPTYDGQNFCIQRFLERLKEVKGQHDALFVDNSLDNKHADAIRTAGFEVIKTTPQEDRIATIVNNRKIIINRAIEKKYDYLLFLDTDVLPPPDIIPRLVAHNKDMITGVYLGGLRIQGKIKQTPVLYDFSHRRDYFKPIPLNDVLCDQIREIAACGFGCILISRNVLEKVTMRYNKTLGSGEDIPYCRDAREIHNYKIYTDTSIKCTHMQPNKDLDFPAGIAHFSFGYDLE